MFFHASENNRSSTVFKYFQEAIEFHGSPLSRIRTDHGGKNVLITDYRKETRGYGRNSSIAGKSVHNQRIERFWRDVRKDIVNFYLILFFCHSLLEA